MKTFDYSSATNILVHFNIGRGGHFHNPGHKKYVSTVDGLPDCFGDAIIINEDENGQPLPDSEWKLIDSGGNAILEGREEIESPTGVLDWDGGYDTDIVEYLSECSDDEYQLIIEAYNDGEYVDEEVIDYACQATGQLRVKPLNPFTYSTGIRVDGDTMVIHTQDGDRTISRDQIDDEDDARDVTSDMGFVSESMEKIVSAMEDEDWFEEE